MAKFKDTAGHEWDVQMTVQGVKDVRDALELDLLDNAGRRGGVMGELASDPIKVCDVVFVLCRQQAEDAEVTSEDFGHSLGGNALAEATDALIEAYISFFRPHQRKALGKIRDKMGTLETMITREVEARLESGEMEKEMRAELEKGIQAERESRLTGGEKSTDTPASSESTPAP